MTPESHDALRRAHPALFKRMRHSRTVAGCWFWIGALASNGYSRVWLDGDSRYAHCVIFGLAHDVTLDSGEVLTPLRRDQLRTTRSCHHRRPAPEPG